MVNVFDTNVLLFVFFLIYRLTKSTVILVLKNFIFFNPAKSEDHMKKLHCKRKGHF